MILAAGYATRLYPLTKDKPKPLLEVAGKPIIEHIINNISEIDDIDEIFVVTNNKFFIRFLDWKANLNLNKITVVNDKSTSNEDRLGSLGDIKYVVENMNIQDDILIVAGDNLFELKLADMRKEYKNKPLIALYDVKNTELAKLYGIVSVDEENRITDFEEKPKNPKSTLSSTGIYFFPASTIKKLIHFVDNYGKDKAGDFLQWLYKEENVYCYITKEKWFDIGSLDQLEQARKEFK